MVKINFTNLLRHVHIQIVHNAALAKFANLVHLQRERLGYSKAPLLHMIMAEKHIIERMICYSALAIVVKQTETDGACLFFLSQKSIHELH